MGNCGGMEGRDTNRENDDCGQNFILVKSQLSQGLYTPLPYDDDGPYISHVHLN